MKALEPAWTGLTFTDRSSTWLETHQMGSRAQFDKLLQDIEPSQTTKSLAASAHRTLRQYLADHEDFRDVHLDTFLAGSYRRNTSIRPRIVNGESCKPDIDI